MLTVGGSTKGVMASSILWVDAAYTRLRVSFTGSLEGARSV